VTDAWRAVVPGHDVLFIGLLVVFEATVGVMILFGGRLAQVGLVGAIAFHVRLALFFSWFFTVYGLAMLLPLVMLLRAERRAAAAPPILGTCNQHRWARRRLAQGRSRPVSPAQFLPNLTRSSSWTRSSWQARSFWMMFGLATVVRCSSGVLSISGRMTRLGVACAIAFHLALCLMGWGVTV
jgi:hypothetical protein